LAIIFKGSALHGAALKPNKILQGFGLNSNKLLLNNLLQQTHVNIPANLVVDFQSLNKKKSLLKAILYK
jgi:hypothetical protein